MGDKPHLVIHSNAPWAGTGYSQQTALFAPKLAEHYELAISSFWGLEGNVLPWNGIPVLPGQGQTYGNECIEEHLHALWGGDLRLGLVLTLMDVWVLDPRIWSRANVAAWVPVDHEPAPDPVLDFFAHSGAVPIAMSKFGREQLAEFDPLYCPHAVDTETYRPIDKRKARKATNMPEDAFIVGMVAANKGNPSRKCFTEAFLAFKAFHDRHPDAQLYIHSEITGRFQGVDLRRLLRSIGIPQDAVIACDQYRAVHLPFNAETMAHVFSSLDVLLSPSAGEGFGIPVIEAQACGVPVIVSDFSAQPELVGAGWLVKGAKTFTQIEAWQFQPDVEDITQALLRAYNCQGDETVAKKARTKAEEYDVGRVLEEHMLPALETAAERFTEREPVAVAA